ncbi:MAG: universal stress protein [Planctomycetes bacterium]|nr:universal stress protein [Planctomycetota bacterium]
MLPIRKILHPTDYSDLSCPAFDFACSLARDLNAEVVVCHVAPPAISATADGVVVTLPAGEDELMTKKLQEVISDDPDVRVSHKLLRGDPADEIARFACEAKVDVIVLGTHGRGLGHLLMGSVAEGVMRKAPCPVVTIKTPAPIAPTATAMKEATKQPVGCCSG